MAGSLWLTEPSLPLRGRVAFALIVIIAVSWMLHAARVLTSRRVLLVSHQVVAAWMAVVFSLVFVGGMIAIAVRRLGVRHHRRRGDCLSVPHRVVRVTGKRRPHEIPVCPGHGSDDGGISIDVDASERRAEDEQSATQVCTLKVSGMTCAGREAAVRMAARSVDGVTAVEVSYAKGNAEVTFDPSKTTPAAIAKEVTEKSGFKAEPVPPTN